MGRDGPKIGIFGGSFDPPHHGHTHLILSLKESHALDEVLIIPAQNNPLKAAEASAKDRLQMCHLAFDTVPGCTVLDIEVTRTSPSYTIETLRWLMENYAGCKAAERFLLLGADVISSLPQWKDIEEVFSLAHPLIASRGGIDLRQCSHLPSKLFQAVKDGWTDTGLLDISSTIIRDRLCKKLYIDHLVKESVVRYILSSHIYLQQKE